MSAGYPSKHRARHAFDRGVLDGFRRRAVRNPYENEWLRDLYARGRKLGMEGRRPRLPQPTRKPPRPSTRPGGRPRPFAPPPRRGGWR
jgi:hypothetical protein